MRARTLALALLVVFTAGYMLVDGARALLLGDYFTIGGELGPWAALLAAVGLDPRSTLVKWNFVVYGAAWLAALALYLRGRVGRGVLIAFAIGGLAYLVIGTVFAIAQLALLLLDRPQGTETR